VKLALLGAGFSTGALLGCTALLGGDGYSAVPEGSDSGGPPPPEDGPVGHDGPDSQPSGDACASFTPTSKSAFEGLQNAVCSGLICSPEPSTSYASSPYCTGAVTPTVATTTTDAGCLIPIPGPAPDAGPVDAAGSDTGSGASDAGDDGAADDASAPVDSATPPPADAGPQPPPCSAIGSTLPDGGTVTLGGKPFTYPQGQGQTLYVVGSTALLPYVGYIAQSYEQGVGSGSDGGPASQFTVVYAGAGSCVGVQAVYVTGTAVPPPIKTLSKTATYFDPDPNNNKLGLPLQYTCTIDDASRAADVGASDVFPSSCAAHYPSPSENDIVTNGYVDSFGPVQIMEMVVPFNSSASQISYEEAQLVWGWGSAAAVSPWLEGAFLFERSSTSGTQSMIGAAIGLNPSVWLGGLNAGSSGNIQTYLLNVFNFGLPDGGTLGGTVDAGGNADLALGILSADYVDNHRTQLRPLAYQDQGEGCAWLPDSTPNARDKTNVREGRYPIWGPSHLISTAQGGHPANPLTATLIAGLNGLDPNLNAKADAIAEYANAGLIPTCAMHVARQSDGQDYQPYVPPLRTSCSCYYDYVQGSTACTACSADSDCTALGAGPAGSGYVCNKFGPTQKGFCEPLGGNQ
jgi:ABC-type phosphate transport system substrate-binding protein